MQEVTVPVMVSVEGRRKCREGLAVFATIPDILFFICYYKPAVKSTAA